MKFEWLGLSWRPGCGRSLPLSPEPGAQGACRPLTIICVRVQLLLPHQRGRIGGDVAGRFRITTSPPARRCCTESIPTSSFDHIHLCLQLSFFSRSISYRPCNLKILVLTSFSTLSSSQPFPPSPNPNHPAFKFHLTSRNHAGATRIPSADL